MGRIAVVRQAGPADVAAAAEVWYASHLARRNGRRLPKEHRDRVQERMTAPAALLLVAEEPRDNQPYDGPAGAPVVGVVLGLPGCEDNGAGPPVPGLLHISLVSVVPERWGENVGHLLIDAILRAAALHGYRSVQLWTHADNARAHRLYRGSGFRRTGRATVDDWGELIIQYQRGLTDITPG